MPIEFIKPLEDMEVMEKTRATLECELRLTKPGLEAKWYKNGEEITESERVKILVKGTKHTLVYEATELDDDAEYTCTIGKTSTKCKLTITGKQVSNCSIVAPVCSRGF